MADVFLSYARPSQKDAMRIADCLRAAGYSVWYDESLPAHRAYADVIAEQLDAASTVLVLWSTEAAESQWVRSEANRARETGRLVQLRLDDTRLPMPFDQIQCADFRQWSGDCHAAEWRTVVGSIGALTGEAPPPPPRARTSGIDAGRRRLLLGGGAAAVLAAGAFIWWRKQEPPMSPEAKLLLEKGMNALQANDALDPEDVGSTGQAVALLTQTTQQAPRSATAWGALALAYAVRRRAAPVSDRPGLEARGREAARSALEIDPKEPRALAAERIMDPVYRNWMAAEQADRKALAHNPRFPILLFVLSDMLGSVGRWREATELSNRLDRKKFLLPGAERKAILNLWSAGELQDADEAIAAAVERWPDQRQVWRTRLVYLLYGGRPTEALAMLGDAASRPRDLVPGVVEAATATAQALVGSMGRADAIAANLDFVKANPALTLPVVHAVVALGDGPTAFSMLKGYYFGEGEWAALAPPGGDQDRQTSPLFQPPMRGLWTDRRFEALVRRIGLSDYWQKSGTRPDYMRG